MPRLIIQNGVETVTHELHEELMTVGRAEENSVRITDISVSGRHAELHREGAFYRVKDLGSTNGTRVNGETIRDSVLRPGDRVRFGKVDARFEIEARTEPPATAPAATTTAPTETAAPPSDFVNASPFPRRKKTRDPLRLALIAAIAIALLAFVLSMISVCLMHAQL